MKNLLFPYLVLLALSGCTAHIKTDEGHTTQDTAVASHTQTLHFVGPIDLTITLTSQDNFKTAVLTDNADRVFQMYSAPTASGMRMIDGVNTSIQFKEGQGVVEFVKGKPVSIQEVKP